MQNSQSIVFIWTETYREIFKFALVYFKLKTFPKEEKKAISKWFFNYFVCVILSKQQVILPKNLFWKVTVVKENLWDLFNMHRYRKFVICFADMIEKISRNWIPGEIDFDIEHQGTVKKLQLTYFHIKISK